MIRNIIVPLDMTPLAEAVLAYAAPLAQGLNAGLTLVHVFERPAAVGRTGQETTAHDLEAAAESARQYLEGQANELRTVGLNVETRLIEGSPAHELVLLAERDADEGNLIALSTHGRSGVPRAFLGSVASRLLQHSKLPLLIIRPRSPLRRPARLDLIVASLDGSEIGESALPLVTQLARALNVPVLLLQVVGLVSIGYAPRELQGDLLRQAQESAAAYLYNVSHRLRTQGINAEFEVLTHASVDAAIVEQVKGRRGTLIAMSTHGRSGLGRWALGSVTDHVVRLSGAPVLVVRPV